MPEFDTSREKLTAAAAGLDQVRRQLFTAREALRNARADRAELDRRPEHDEAGNEAARQKVAQLEAQVEELESGLATGASKLKDSHHDFSVFLDPTENIERLDDRFPILLMPVR